MIYSLRQRHRYIWLVLAFLLPVGFVAAYFAIPTAIEENEFEVLQPVLYSKLLQTAESEYFKIDIRRDETLPDKQLEIQFKQAVSAIQLEVKIANNMTTNIEQATTILGKLTSQRRHRFNLNNYWSRQESFALLFYDSHRKELIDSIEIIQK